ncbi:MAG: tRNA dihydrouridine synthase [Planctomycetota bacterium]|jgi:nifR3 family TIM-barrel protein
MSKAAAKFLEIGYDLIDLNFACPAPKVLRRLRGGHLMSKPQVIREAFLRTREKVDCPVFMKIRIGYNSSAESKEHFWQICENAATDGVDMLAIHGRTVEQKYRGKANWDTIAAVKKRFPNLTIFGSGDIYTAETALERRQTSGIDGVIVARGAIGNPWIFNELKALWNEQGKPVGPTVQEVGEVMLEHFRLICEEYPERKAYPYFRKFAVGYCKRHPERKKTMLAIMAAKTKADVVSIIQDACDLV